ncbi:hypothetical protein TRFO_20092 [Tritrichomonas foetus]|uniref:Uncharacterized protein n=1 Tax=Tritrichomonas foetus TaxID=1144522 RepID=A0A1J4KHB8_9EUKA|nr:hypothetical protein TRFO_20092 [Tritrichomonas foetus]|eukprot:OHT10587.1 hypothetical protein TRFO_20092 [Tritrichomonas foetus]
MEEDFLAHIEKIIQQRSVTEPSVYIKNLQKLKELLRSKIKKINNERQKIRQKYEILKKSDKEEISEIAQDKEWVKFYVSWADFYQNQTRNPDNGVSEFHKQISEKLEKQTQRLKKLQSYSAQLRNSVSALHESKSAHREKRFQEAETIFKRFNFRINNEKQKNYDDKIKNAKMEFQRLIESLATLNAQKSQIETSCKELQKSNHQSEMEIVKIEENLKSREEATNQSWESVKRGNIELKARIRNAKIQVASLSRNINSIDEVIKAAQASLHELTKSQPIVANIYNITKSISNKKGQI